MPVNSKCHYVMRDVLKVHRQYNKESLRRGLGSMIVCYTHRLKAVNRCVHRCAGLVTDLHKAETQRSQLWNIFITIGFQWLDAAPSLNIKAQMSFFSVSFGKQMLHYLSASEREINAKQLTSCSTGPVLSSNTFHLRFHTLKKLKTILTIIHSPLI